MFTLFWTHYSLVVFSLPYIVPFYLQMVGEDHHIEENEKK